MHTKHYKQYIYESNEDYMFFTINMICFSICISITNPTILHISLQKPYSVGEEMRRLRKNISKILQNFLKVSSTSNLEVLYKLSNKRWIYSIVCVCVKKKMRVGMFFKKDGVSFQRTLLLLFFPPLASSCDGAHLGHRP